MTVFGNARSPEIRTDRRTTARVWTVFAVALLGTCSVVAAQAQNLVRGNSPSMANVTDVTGGMNYLLQNDDMVALQVNQNGNTTTTSVVTLNTTGSQITSSKTTQLATSTLNDSFDPNAGKTAAEAVGRMYSTGSDIVALLAAVDATTPPANNDSWTLTLFDPLTGFQSTTSLNTFFHPHGTVSTQVLMGNFKGDNLVEPLIFYTNAINPQKYEWGMQVVTPTDPAVEGPPNATHPELNNVGKTGPIPVMGSLVVGDFNGDGRDEIAALLNDYQTIAFYSVDPNTFAITQLFTIPIQAVVDNGTDTVTVQMKPGQVALTSGRFRNLSPGITNADLVVFGQINKLTTATGGNLNVNNGYSVIPIQLTASNGSFTATVIPLPGAGGITPFFRFPDYHGANGALAQSAQFENWPQQNQEQLLLGIQTTDGASYIEIGDFKPDQSLDTFRWYSEDERKSSGSDDLLVNMQVGNFDNLNPDGSHNPLQQIQTEEYLDSGIFLNEHIFILDVHVPSPLPPEVDKPSDWLTQHSDYGTNVQIPLGVAIPPGQDMLIPADVQGRSLRLGPPTIARIDQQKQLDLILATPPMHVDYVATQDQGFPGCPDPGTPCVMNISVRPSLNKSVDAPFTTTFNFTSSSMNQSQQSTTTGWGVATKTSVGASFAFNDGEENASASIKDTVKTAHDENVKNAWGNYQSKTTSVEATTGLTDHIFDTTRGVNVYYYPVLGCETNQATCYNGQNPNGPLYVEFSVPDQIHTEDVDGATQDWYQPVHEPGNVLSYPWDQQQLQAQFTGQMNPLTQSPPTCMAIGAGTTATSTTWAQGQSASSTSGSSSTFSNELSMSYSEGVGISEVDDADINFSASVTTNTSLYNLNESSTSLQESQGITLTIPSFNETKAGSYGFGQTIFGLQNTVNKPSESACLPGQISTADNPCVVVNDPNGKPIQVVGTGPIFTGYLADPLGGNNAYIGCGQQGAFWQNIYTQPDVALNHAERWTWSQSAETVSFNKPDQSGTEPMQDNVFYHMKGFFITAKGTSTAGAAPVANALPSGPNLVEALPSDSLILTTRVYNYSLVDTNALDRNSTVKVRFYGQLYCGTNNPKDPSCQSGTTTPCPAGNVCGNSFQIGQDQTIQAIPGFRSYDGNDAPNWALSSVEFDPGNYAATKNGSVDMVFWVVVWMQDASGNLVAETPDHGLTSIPDPNVTQITNVPIEAHSNNVGMYGVHQQFHILPPEITPPGAAPGTGSLTNIALSVSPQATLDQQTPLTATLQAAGAPVGSVTIAYYDGPTTSSGSLLDVQSILSLQPGVNYTHRSIYTPKTCGLHTLYASAWLPNSPNLTISSTVNVTLQPANQIQVILNALQTMTFTDQQTLTNLTTLLNSANQAYQQGQTQSAETLLGMFLQEAAGASGKALDAESANTLVRLTNVLFSCGTSGFALSAQPDTATVSSGAQATYALAVTPSGGFAGNVALTCSGAPQGSMCSVSTPSVTLDGTTQAPLTVTVTTTPGPAMAGMLGGANSLRWGGVKGLLTILAGLLAMALLWRARLSSALIACVVALVLLGGAVGCGSGSSSSGGATPAGTYTLTVQGASGKTLGKTTLTLVVQ